MQFGRLLLPFERLRAGVIRDWRPRAACILLLTLALAACVGSDRTARSVNQAQAAPTPAPVSGMGLEPPTATAAPQTTIRSPSFTTTASPSSTAVASSTFTAAPSLTPTATPLTCWGQGGRFEHGSLRSDLLKLPMEYSVYLPPCYDHQPERRYPVLYMIHGMNYNNDQWDRLGADDAADDLVAAGEINPFIIVMPRDRSWEQPADDPFGQVLVDVLVPFIDEQYRTLPQRSSRAIGGLSRGAGWAVHLGLSRWELFGAIGGHSLPVFWSDTGRVRGWLAAIPPESMPRIYLDIGEKDRQSIMQSALWFEDVLDEAGIPHEWHLYPGYHEEAYWEAHVEDYLRWYAAGW